MQAWNLQSQMQLVAIKSHFFILLLDFLFVEQHHHSLEAVENVVEGHKFHLLATYV